MTNIETLDLIATTMKLDGVTTLTEQEIKDAFIECALTSFMAIADDDDSKMMNVKNKIKNHTGALGQTAAGIKRMLEMEKKMKQGLN